MSRILNVVLSHQAERVLRPWLDWWKKTCPDAEILLVFSGSEKDFAELNHDRKIRVANQRLKTSHHQRERQAYIDVWKSIAGYLEEHAEYSHVIFMEYDHIPLRRDLPDVWLNYLQKHHADVAGYAVTRVDGTNNPHYLYHEINHEWSRFLRTFSRRADRGVSVSMLGTGSMWTRESFLAVASFPEPFPVYLEIWIPTIAHHLGFRVIDMPVEQKKWVRSRGEFSSLIEPARQAGAWSIHPIKFPPPSR